MLGDRVPAGALRVWNVSFDLPFPQSIVFLMRGRFAIAVAFLAFLQVAGGHWAILQTGAWMGMIVFYAKDGDYSGAITKTFDGKHPCALCRAVQDGRRQEEKKVPALQLELKKDFIISSFLFQVAPDFAWREYFQFQRTLLGITLEPLIPPPRNLVEL